MEVMSHDAPGVVFEMDFTESPSPSTPPHKHSYPQVPRSPYAHSESGMQEEDVQGLTYPPSFLTSLPVLHPPVQRYDTAPSPPLTPSPSSSSSTSPVPHSHPRSCRADAASHINSHPQGQSHAQGPPPIRALNAAQFAKLHAQYATTHAPDGVLFPFLHGLEGENDLQNSFFASTSGSPSSSDGEDEACGEGKRRRRCVPRVPRFRGLVWVASDEDDVEAYERAVRARQHSEFDDDEDDLSDEEYSSSEASEGIDMDMDLDGPARSTGVGVVGMDVDSEDEVAGAERTITAPPSVMDLTDHDEGNHMHPVMGRRPALSAIDTSKEQIAHGHRLSNASSTSSFTSDDPSPSLTSPDSGLPTPPTPPSSLPEDEKILSSHPSAHAQAKSHRSPVPERVALTSTFKPRELLCIDRASGETRFIEPRVPEGISLRNFGIQVPIFATLSDIVVYSPRGNTAAALAVATHFAHAIESKRAERAARGQKDLLYYNVFVLHASPEEMVKEMPTVVSRMSDEVVGAHTQGTDAETTSETHSADTHTAASPRREAQQEICLHRANTISFAQREKDEMRELTQASEIVTFPVEDDSSAEFNASSTKTHWDASRGQIFLGNANDVPTPVAGHSEWDSSTNDPARGLGFDFCIECDDMAPFPSNAHMHAAEEHLARLEKRWQDHCLREFTKGGEKDEKEWDRSIPHRPPPPANLVVHLPFPSSVAYAGNSVLPFIAWLEALLRPAEPVTFRELRERRDRDAEQRRVTASRPVARRSTNAGHAYHNPNYQQYSQFGGPSSLPPPTAFPTSFLPTQGSGPASSYTRMRSTSATHLTSPPQGPTPPLPALRTRPLKVLIFSADGYTESSSLALCLLMTLRKLSLPEAYLELQNEKRRSFFVYPAEIVPMKRIEARLERAAAGTPTRQGRPPAQSVSYAAGSDLSKFMSHAQQNQAEEELGASAPTSTGVVRRPRASTLPPPLSSPSDHQVWFNDPRFDGSFPSRVLPFLYLGNLNHAANAYMLHALGITHVVSVGECALIPPEHAPTNHGAFQAGLSTAKPGSLWIEEREGRIKVLDIKGVCDDGIDSLEPQLPPICEWIDEARKAGGKVLVHCRVGVSRSATVVIAYVMKHLNVPLVDAYLVVRSRRLSVLIQPNMRLLYNLLGWEIKLAQERAQGDEKRLHGELARALNWPYLAKEVHALNEKYLH